MSKLEKLLFKLLSGNSDANIKFDELKNLLLSLNFKLRVKGDHYIFTHIDIIEIINLQPIGSKAKAYQVKQARNIIVQYNLGDECNE
jgi:hypothetical protein